ncbi:MAG: hypothetical protein WA182_06830 [Candidatus Sulfotelmatobacter sp.]
MAEDPTEHPKPRKKKSATAAEAYGTASRGEGLAPQIRHTKPEVARHCARMIIGCNMDTRAAVSKMWAQEYPDATEAQIESMARTLSASPHVQREMALMLEEIGFGDDALRKLIGLLWQEALGANDKRWPAAVRLLAEITSAGKAAFNNQKIPTLKLDGMDEGLARMLGPAAPTNEDIEEDSTSEQAQ